MKLSKNTGECHHQVPAGEFIFKKTFNCFIDWLPPTVSFTDLLIVTHLLQQFRCLLWNYLNLFKWWIICANINIIIHDIWNLVTLLTYKNAEFSLHTNRKALNRQLKP